MNSRFLTFALGLIAGLVLFAAPLLAQSWPQRPVKFIIPFGPGAGADIGARLIQRISRQALGPAGGG